MTQPQSTTDDRRTGPLIQAYGEDGTLAGYVAQGVIVLNPDGSIPATAPVSDATAANQVLQIAQETAINTVLGTTADAAVAAGAAGTNSAKMRRLTTDVAAINTALGTPFQAGGVIGALPAGSAVIGKVGIDQTTPGTTNLVAAGQNGTWNITNISGTVSLPTGASTAANQATMITNQTATGTSSQSVQGGDAAGAATTVKPVLGGATVLAASALPTLTAGNTGALAFDTRQRVLVVPGTAATAAPSSAGTTVSLDYAATTLSTGSAAPKGVLPYIWNGTNTIPQPGDTTGAYVKTNPQTGTDRSLATSTTTAVLMAANTTRTKFYVKNDTAIDVWINIGAVAVATAGSGNIKIANSGGYFEFTGTSAAVNIIAASGTPAITAREF